jgi:choline kinase
MTGLSGVVLAAGSGTRLGGVEKACLEIRGKTILERHFENFAALGLRPEGVRVVYARDGVRRMTECLGGIPIKSSSASASGTLGSFVSCFPSGHALVVHGDLLWQPAMAEAAISTGWGAVVPLDSESGDSEAMKAKVCGNRLVRLSKNLNPADCSGESMGIFLFRKTVLPELGKCCERAASRFGDRASLDDAVTLLAEEGLVKAVFVDGNLWEEIDTPADLQRARRRFQ